MDDPTLLETAFASAESGGPVTANLPLCCLLNLARSVGFRLSRDQSGSRAQLYVWCTTKPDGEPDDVVYIGKSESAARVSNETRWSVLDPHSAEEVYGGFANIIRRNRAVSIPIAVDPVPGRGDGFDPTTLLETINGLEGAYYERLRERALSEDEWTIPDIETVLIRLAVRCGVPIANSAGTGLWINWIGDLRDAMAVVATDAVRAAEWPMQMDCQGCSVAV